jgi:glycosyltransferase involved in cell wall biosynthesis
MADPRVTVGLAVYNGENFLAEALRSLVDQDYPDMEILVADNASTDGTRAICERFAAEDSRVRILRSEVNRGLGWNHNRLLPEARGEYFKWAAHDDRYVSSFISSCVAVLDEQPDVVLCYTNTVDIDADGAFMKAWPATDRASSADPLVRFRDVMMNERQCFPVYGLMRTDVLRGTVLMGSYAGSDQPLLAELALHGRFVEIPKPLLEHREHAARSITAYPNTRDRVVLYHPGAAGKVTFPRWQMAREYVRVIVRSPISRGAKVRAWVALGPWARMWWRQLVLGVPGGLRYAYRQRRSSAAQAAGNSAAC